MNNVLNTVLRRSRGLSGLLPVVIALLVVTVLGLVALLSLIAWNLANLLRQVRERKPGARLTVRMVAMLSVPLLRFRPRPWPR